MSFFFSLTYPSSNLDLSFLSFHVLLFLSFLFHLPSFCHVILTTAAKQHPHLFSETIEQMCIGQFVDVLTAPRSAMLCDVLSGRPTYHTTFSSAFFNVSVSISPLVTFLFLYLLAVVSVFEVFFFSNSDSPPFPTNETTSFYYLYYSSSGKECGCHAGDRWCWGGRRSVSSLTDWL